MLRITVEENSEAVVIKLEGRIAGPWAAELGRLWEEKAPAIAKKKLSLDLRETTFADAGGIRVLRAIYSQTGSRNPHRHTLDPVSCRRGRAQELSTSGHGGLRCTTGHETTNQASVPSYRKGEFFKALSAAALADLEPLLAPSTYPSGMVLFTETQPASGIYVVLEGEVKLSINSSDGRRLSFHIAKAGEVLGLSPTLSGGEYEMTADTLYPAKIAHISRQVFLQFLSRHPDVYPSSRAK